MARPNRTNKAKQNKSLKGLDQPNILNGGKSDEILEGGISEDTINGGNGDDVLIGGEGADDFELSEGNDVIQDFNWREGDQIVLPEDIDLSKLQIKEKKDDVILKIKGEFKTKIENTSLKDVIKTIADKARENALDATIPIDENGYQLTNSNQTIVNTGLIIKGVNNQINLPTTQTEISDVIVFDENNKPLKDKLYTVNGNTVTINKPKGYYKIAANFDWNNPGSNYLTWMRDVIQFGDKVGDGTADPINAKNAFRLYMGDKISDIESLSIDGSTSTYQMFDAAARFDGDLSNLDLSEVTDMYSMFRHAARFNNGGNEGIKDWDTSKVTRMRMTFWNALSFNQPVQNGSWNVEAVADDGFNGGMSRMFKNTPIFDQDLSDWSPNIYSGYQTDFNTTLSGNKQSQSKRYPNTQLPNFRGDSPYKADQTVLRTRNLKRWLEGDKEIVLPFNENEINADIVQVQDNNGQTVEFNLDGANLVLPKSGADQYNITVTGLAWDNSKDSNDFNKMNKLRWLNDVIKFADIDDKEGGDIASGKAAFAGYGGQTISDLSNLDTSALTSMQRMFSAAYRFDEDLGENFLTSKVTDAFAMFNSAGVFNNGGSSSIGEWKTGSVSLMSEMFSNAALFNQDLKKWDTSSVRDLQGETPKGGMHNMFRNTPLYEEDLTGWDVEAIEPSLNTSFNTKAIKSDEVIANDQQEKAQGQWPLFGEEQEPDKEDGGNSGGGGGGGGGIGNAPGAPEPSPTPEPPSEPEDGTIDNQPIVPTPETEEDRELRQRSIIKDPKNKDFDEAFIGKDKKKDELNGSNKDDVLKGKGKSDIVNGSKGNDYLYGDKGGDILTGGKGADVLQGGLGKDELSGGGGKDMIYGGDSDDEISGNGGKDTFVLSRGKDIITDFKVGTDTLGLVYALDLKIKQKGDNLLIKTSDDLIHTKLLNVTRDEFFGDFFENNNYLQVPFVEVIVL
jgi:Ca2+-binding RTX toxin-like protein